jgi:hypothetical protein
VVATLVDQQHPRLRDRGVVCVREGSMVGRASILFALLAGSAASADPLVVRCPSGMSAADCEVVTQSVRSVMAKALERGGIDFEQIELTNTEIVAQGQLDALAEGKLKLARTRFLPWDGRAYRTMGNEDPSAEQHLLQMQGSFIEMRGLIFASLMRSPRWLNSGSDFFREYNWLSEVPFRAVFKTGSGRLELSFSLRDSPQPEVVENNRTTAFTSDQEFAEAWKQAASTLFVSPTVSLVGTWERDRYSKERKAPFQDPKEKPIFTLNADGTGSGCLTQVVTEPRSKVDETMVRHRACTNRMLKFTWRADGQRLVLSPVKGAETTVRYTTPPPKTKRDCNRAGDSCRIGKDCCSGSCVKSQCSDPTEGLSTMILSWSDDEVPLVVWGKSSSKPTP